MPQAVIWRQDYYAFGQDYGSTATGNKYKFNGKPLEANTGLYYYGARYYDPVIGRFVSCDPVLGSLENPQTFNPYSYCINNPQTYVDPNGEFFWVPILIGAAIGALAGGGVAYAAGYRPNQGQFWAFVGGGALLGAVGGYFYSSGFTFSVMVGDKAVFSCTWQGIGSTGIAAGLAGGGTSGAAAIATASLTSGINGDYITESMLQDIGFSAQKSSSIMTSDYINDVMTVSFDIDAAVDFLDAHAASTYQGICAKHVREALEAGGLDTSGRPRYAKDYNTYLPTIGFHEVVKDNCTYQKGDIAVFQNYSKGHPAGHIQMYNGSQWASDCMQRRFWPNRTYELYNDYSIFRW